MQKLMEEKLTMNIPGFTAEASLYKTSECYRIATEADRTSGVVHPAQSSFPSGAASILVGDRFLSPVIFPKLCLVYRCRWKDVSPGAPFPPRIVWDCGFEWIC
jgi:hypothetical protein